ncbi:MAG: NUDIX hydrolase [Clostridia bacterium]|nr:NUDIX hydrolase [Clostridia bacterium]
MKIIEIFDDNYSDNKIYERNRYAVRAVILNGNKVFVEYAKSKPIIMLPGGGVEGEESKEACIIRECQEECGLVVKPLKQLFVIKEYYNDIIFHSSYMLCEAVDNCQPNPTEAEMQLKVKNFYQDIAIVCSDLKGILDNIQDKESELYGMNYREYLAVKEILNIVQNNK